MSTSRDIISHAHLLFDAHGEDAPIAAALRAQATADRGDGAGFTLWRPIGSLSSLLLSHAAAAGEGVR